MKHKFTKITLLTAVVAGFTAACNPASAVSYTHLTLPTT